jgi:hypothetical protein
MGKTDNIDLNRWLDHHQTAKRFQEYAIRRLDILIISICGAGIYLIFEILKFSKEHSLNIIETPLKIGGLLFTLAIIINFISQWTGFFANKNEEAYAECKICKLRGNSYDKKDMVEFDKKATKNNKLTGWFNAISTILMVCGLLILLVYCAITF